MVNEYEIVYLEDQNSSEVNELRYGGKPGEGDITAYLKSKLNGVYKVVIKETPEFAYQGLNVLVEKIGWEGFGKWFSGEEDNEIFPLVNKIKNLKLRVTESLKKSKIPRIKTEINLEQLLS